MIDLLLDVIFPRNVCCLCRDPGLFWSRRPWCEACDAIMKESRAGFTICERCGKFLMDQHLCWDCQEEEPLFNIARAVGPYEGCYRQLIKQYKFMEKKHLASIMAKMMSQVVLKNRNFWPLDIVVPVPMSREGLLRRGFNQSDLLASRIARRIRIRFEPQALKRVKFSSPQRELSREMRRKNLSQAFVVENPKRVKGKNILLVDDVYTTGSTARECTKTLLEGGAKRVSVIAWASGKGFGAEL